MLEPTALNSTWRYVRWNAEKKCLEPDMTRDGTTLTAVLSELEAILALLTVEGTVTRFHPTWPLTSSMAGESLTCCLQMGMMATESRRLHEHIRHLCGLAVTQLIGMNIRPERMGRSQLAQMISRALGQTSVLGVKVLWPLLQLVDKRGGLHVLLKGGPAETRPIRGAGVVCQPHVAT